MSIRLLQERAFVHEILFGPVSDALRGFPASLVLDGEVVAITDEGRPDFETLQQRLRPRDGGLPGYLAAYFDNVLGGCDLFAVL